MFLYTNQKYTNEALILIGTRYILLDMFHYTNHITKKIQKIR